MDPATAFLALSATKHAAQGISSYQEARTSAKNDELAAFTAGTRALERDANTRDELNRVISSIRSSIAASGLSLKSPTSQTVLADANTTLTRERIIQRNNDRTEAANLRRSAAAKRRRATVSLVTGAINAGPSLVALGGY